MLTVTSTLTFESTDGTSMVTDFSSLLTSAINSVSSIETFISLSILNIPSSKYIVNNTLPSLTTIFESSFSTFLAIPSPVVLPSSTYLVVFFTVYLPLCNCFSFFKIVSFITSAFTTGVTAPNTDVAIIITDNSLHIFFLNILYPPIS